MSLKKVIFFLSLIFPPSLLFAQSPFMLKPELPAVVKAGAISYSFQIEDSQKKKTISHKDLVKTHTKILHLIVYDAAKKEFRHLHPVYKNKKWSAELNLSTNGKYFIWAQGSLKKGKDFSIFTQLQVSDGLPENQILATGDHRQGSDKGTVIQLGSDKIIAGEESMIPFKVSREDGQQPRLGPYLGAFAHVIAVSQDGQNLIHVHPMPGEQLNSGMIHAAFPNPGEYRIWIELMESGELKQVPVSVQVLAK